MKKASFASLDDSASFGITLSVVVPAFNEEELVEEFVEKSRRDLSKVADDWEIIPF